MFSLDKTLPIIIDNKRKGVIGEQIVKKIYKERGSKIIPARSGCDFIAINWINGTKQKFREYVEVKTGLSRQTKRQRQVMKKAIRNGDNYTIYHISDSFLKKFLLNNEGFWNEM